MIKTVLSKARDATARHEERRTPLGVKYCVADSIEFVPADHWDAIAAHSTVFLGRRYLAALERHSPDNTQQRFVIVYAQGQPIAVMSAQIAELYGAQFIAEGDKASKKKSVLERVRERVLVCGNLVSSGMHGVAFAPGCDLELGWRAVAEALYRIRRSEKINGAIDFVLIKDLAGSDFPPSEVLRRYSYRPIQSDPEMILTLQPDCKSFDDYLQSLTSKYRGKIKKLGKTLDKAGYRVETLTDVAAHEDVLHSLYLEVERRAPVRLATIAHGYFGAMSEALGENFVCSVIRNDERIVGFVTTVIDGDEAIGYYVGVDYAVNAELPIYLRLLQLVIADGTRHGCTKISFGRTALEPKANLGAKPVETHVWMRHRVPALNFVLRKFFPIIPCGEAPERSPMKSS